MDPATALRRPTSGELLRWGQSLAFVGSWDEACEMLRRAVEATPSNLEARTSLVETLFRARRYPEAEAAADGLLLRAPDDLYALVLRAAIVSRMDPGRALALAEDAARRSPERAGAWAMSNRPDPQGNTISEALPRLGAIRREVDYVIGKLAPLLKQR